MEAAPESLRIRILRAIEERPAHRSLSAERRNGGTENDSVPRSPFPVPRQLRLIAEELLKDAKSGPPNHDTALTLLAADALITYACEAEAEAGATEVC